MQALEQSLKKKDASKRVNSFGVPLNFNFLSSLKVNCQLLRMENIFCLLIKSEGKKAS